MAAGGGRLRCKSKPVPAKGGAAQSQQKTSCDGWMIVRVHRSLEVQRGQAEEATGTMRRQQQYSRSSIASARRFGLWSPRKLVLNPNSLPNLSGQNWASVDVHRGAKGAKQALRHNKVF